MTQLAFSSISALDRPLAGAAEAAAAVGLDGLEVTARPPHLDPEAGLEAARAAGRTVRAAGLSVTAYGSYLGRPDVCALASARREAEIAGALEAPLLRVWAEPAAAGPAQSTSDQEALRAVATLLREACDVALALGVVVVVERHLGSLADTPERIARLLDAVDRENFALNYQVLDLLPAEAAEAQPADAARLVRHARYFHLKNYQPNPGGSGPLVPGGSLENGVLDYRAILGAALDAGYTGPLTLEFLSWEPLPLEEKLATDVAYLRQLLAEREAG